LSKECQIQGVFFYVQFFHFLFSALICSTSVLISCGESLAAYFGMRPLPLLMMSRRSSLGAALTLSEISEGPPKWRPSAVLP